MEINSSVSTMNDKTKLKMVFLGDQSVGKSSIIEKYIHDRFQESLNPTIGIDFLARNIKYKAKSYRLQLWDTAGQQRYRSLIPSYLKNADFALIVFDVTSKDSFDNVQSWINLFNQNKNKEGFTYLVGNKIDLNCRQVSKTQAKCKADKLGKPYFEISAKNGQNVQELFMKMIQQAINKTQKVEMANNLKKQMIAAHSRIEEQKSSKRLSSQNARKITAQNGQEVAIINSKVLKNTKIEKEGDGKNKGCC